MQAVLAKAFYKKFATNLIIWLLAIAGVSFALFYSVHNGEAKLWLLICFAVLWIIVIFFGIFFQIKYILDVFAIKKEKFMTVTGKVIDLKRVEEGGDPPTVSIYPVIQDEETHKTIKLDIVDRKVQTTCKYTFLYLPHTKLAMVVEDFSQTRVIES